MLFKDEMHQYAWLKIPIVLCLLAIISIPLIVTNDLAYVFITGKNFTFRIVTDVLFALYLVLMLYDKNYQPKNSWILVTFGLLLLVSVISALVGEDAVFSFFGSYFRMDGIIALIHLFMYFVVLSHVINTKERWHYFFYVTTAVALTVAILALVNNNPASTFGNVQYSAMYLFFSIFFVALLIAQTDSRARQVLLMGMAVIMAYVMLIAAERGVLCAFLCAIVISASYFYYYQRPKYFKYGLMALLLGMLILSAILFLFRDSLTHSQTGFMRYFNFDSYKEGANIRGGLWAMAFQGFTEHPFWGWGINNFNYVFNQHYNPIYCTSELWVDRAHNNYLEWLVSGGIVGFIAFLSLLFAPIFYLFTTVKKVFSVAERAILLGVLSGYLILNLFYFDTLTSYLCLITVLAYIHAQVSKPFPAIVLPKQYISFAVLPTLVIACTLSIYYLTMPSLLAAHDAMLASQTNNLKEQYQLMHRAWMRHGIGNQEIMEKYNPVIMQLLGSDTLTPQEKQTIALQTQEKLDQFIKNKPKEPRAYYFLISLYMAMGDFDNAKKTLSAVQRLTPNKEFTMMVEGVMELSLGNLEKSKDLFKQSMCLETSRMLYEQITAR